MRTTVDLSAEAYQIAKTVARERGVSLGSVISEFITNTIHPAKPGDPSGSDEEFPQFRCYRRVTTEDVEAMEDL